MALDPLKFQVAIQDDATSQLSSIEAALNSLKDKTISVKVEGLSDLQNLLSALQHQQVSNLGKDVGNAINEASRNLQKEAQDAVRTSLGNLAQDLASIKTAIQNDNFTAFSNRIQTCAEKVNLLDEAFKKFKVTIGENEELKNLLTGLGAAIREVSSAMSAMNSVRNSGGAKAQKEELKQQEEGLIKVTNAIGRVRDAASGDGGASSGSVAFMESINKVGERNIQTLIKEQGHIERLIAIAKKSIDFGEGHPVLGMGRLRGDQMQNLQNLEQLKNVIKEILFAANQGDQTAIRFLNTLGSLKTISFGKDLMGNNITLLGGHFDQLTHSVTGTASAMRQLNKDMRLDFNKAANKEKLAAEAEAVKKLAASYKSMQQESNAMRSQSESALASRIRMLREQSSDLQKLLSVGKIGLGEGQYNSVRDALREIRKELQQIETITQRGGNSTGLLRSLSVGRDYSGVIASGRAVADMRNKQAQETNLASRAVSQLTMEEQRLAQALNQATNSARGQSQVLSDLKSLATQYLGVWGGQQFLNNIIQIGGQLEMQRLSIGAILGDAAQANDLFEKIKGLAIQSPFGVVELDQMTKQLTAYGFEYNELFDMTKRLADISAATGTGVDRLALALGHVRSEAALSGYTLRQFSMANIPLAQKLSERLSEIEHRFVSIADVRKRVRSKEIGYEDVVAVLKEMTDEGGMFYRAQETMSQSVKARFKNLKDSMDIMYGEMAESKVGDGLKEVAITLTNLTRNWEELAAAIATVTALYGGKKMIAFLNANAINAYSSSITRLGMNLGSLTATELRELAYSGQLSKQRLLEAVATGQVSVEDAKLAAAKWGLNNAQLAQVASGQRTIASLTANSIATSKYSVAQLRAIATTRQFALGSKGLAVAMNVVATNAKKARSALLGLLKAAWPVALITAGVEAWMHYRKQSEQAAEAAENAFTRGTESVRNLRDALQSLPKYEIVNGTANLDDGALRNGIKNAVNELKNYHVLANDLIAKVNMTDSNGKPIMSLAEQYNYLRSQVELAEQAMEEFQRTSSAQESALNSTGGIGNDNALEDINDYFSSRKAFIEKTNEFVEKYKNQAKVAIDAARDEDEAFRKQTEGMANYAEMLRILVTETDSLGNKMDFSKGFNVFWGMPNMQSTDFRSLWSGVGGQFNEAKKELDNWATGFRAAMEGSFGYDFSHLTEVQLENIRRHIWDFSNSPELSKLDEETRKWIRDYLGRKWNITFSTNAETVLKDFDEMQNHIEKLVGKKWVIKLKLQSVGSFEELYDTLDKDVKEAKETIKKLGTSFTNERKKQLESNVIDDTQLSGKEKEYRDAYKKLRKAKAASDQEGFKLSSLEEKESGRTGRSGSKSEDKDARRLREIVKLYKDAYDWYGKYEKQVGEGSALAKVKEQFEPLFKQFEEQFKQKLSLDSIPLYKENLVSLLDEAQKLYESPKHKNSYMVEAIKTIRDAINNVDYEEAQRKMDEYASKVQIELDGLTRAWDMFNNVREATGNIDLAVQLSGADYQAGQTRNLADSLKKKIEQDFASANAVAIPFDINMSDKDIENNIKNAIPKESEERIKGIVEEYKKWRDLQREVFNDAINNYAKILGSLVDHKSQIEKIEDEYKKEVELLKILLDSGKITQEQYDKGVGIARGNADSKEWQASTSYINLMNNSLSMTRSEIEAAANMQRDYLNRELERGAIDAQKYVEEMSKLQNLEREWSDKGFLGLRGGVGAFLSGGNDGLLNYYQTRAKKARTDYANADNKNSKDAKEKLKEAKHYEGLYSSLVKLTDGAKKVFTAFQTLQAGIDLVANLFDSLGMKGAATFMSDVSGVLGSGLQGASALSALGPWGMAAGAGLGLLGGLFGLHDKVLQREIERLREDVQKIENNTDLIVQARERTLGYDTGDLRRSYAQQYAPNEARRQKILASDDWFNKFLANTAWGQGFNSVAQNAMYEYYQRNSAGTGYQQQLANLKAEREDYMRMYDAENDKKDSSGEALEEYRKKIAEIDDQILYFTEDLAKELWGIDLKGWANQISDSLWTAFENGEDAIKAFHETAKDIISDVAKRMMNIHLIEPVMTKLEEALFGKVGANGERIGGGAYNMQTGKFNERETLEILGQFFGEGGEFAKVIGSAESFYEMAKKVTGIDFGSDSGGSTSSTIKGVTEQTADLLASYVNAIRADVSVIQAMIAQYFPLYYQALTSGNERLRGIENNTAAIMRSNEAIEKSNQAILDRIDGLRNNTWRVPMA
jgi:hypothetical protein